MLAPLCLLMVVGSVFGVQDAFTSMDSMQALVDTERRLIDTIRNIVSLEQQRLGKLLRYVNHFEAHHQLAAKDVLGYVTNPINAYQLVKRLTSEWAIVAREADGPVLANLTEVAMSLDLPLQSDLAGAAEALCRLQDTYKLDTRDMARGVIDGVQHSQPMTDKQLHRPLRKGLRYLAFGLKMITERSRLDFAAFDAYEIGRLMYVNSDPYHSARWMKVALQLNMEEEGKNPLFETDRAVILDYLAFTLNQLGNVPEALTLTNQYLKLVPNCERNQINRQVYQLHIRLNGSRVPEEREIAKHKKLSTYTTMEVQENYERLCRGEAKVDHRLVCRYVDNHIPYLFLRRLKQEEMSLEPWIAVFHDILYDSEIEEIKRLAGPLIVRSTVTNFIEVAMGTGVQARADNNRVSKSAFLHKFEHKVVDKLDRRAAMIANLTDLSSESLQVLNYGIGGHYEPHWDHSQSPGPDYGFPGFTGNRIATLLLYMSDVEKGGATVFPDIDVAVFPRKGSALLWYNLHRDGVGDPRTKHGACPVLIGSKWACNKWYHEETQEFQRPCLLEQDSLRAMRFQQSASHRR